MDKGERKMTEETGARELVCEERVEAMEPGSEAACEMREEVMEAACGLACEEPEKAGGLDCGAQTDCVESMTLTMDSLSQNEEFARVVVAVFASRLNPTLEELDDIRTAVSEAVTNAVIHGYRGKEGKIELTAAAGDGVLTVQVKDTGVGIADVEQAMEPMFTTAPEGDRSGMGFSFMEAFMDEVFVESALGAGTTVTMRKRIGG